MNKGQFLRHVESDRDCKQGRLDEAVDKGLARAKSERLNGSKLLALAAAGVLTLLMCFTVNLRPVKTAMVEYYLSGSKVPPGSVEVLDGYITELAANVKRYLGGE